MANTPTLLYRGAAPTTSITLYTVPSATTTVVTNIVVANTSTTIQSFSINLDGVALASGTSIPANGVATFDIKQVLGTTKLISGSATSSSVTFHISGMNVA